MITYVKTSRSCDTASRAWYVVRGTISPALEIDGPFHVHRLVFGVAFTEFAILLT
ncbi:MAG TPA: hypothetical protein VMW91_04670 [Desulfosporosinus sp.]|nr:hypothetical protein [Desulfosporosinus sp.]